MCASTSPRRGHSSWYWRPICTCPPPTWTSCCAGARLRSRPAGVLLVVGHDLANLTEGTGRPSDPAVLYTAKSLVRSLDGLVVQRAGQVRRTVLDGEIRREAVDTLVRAARS